MTQEREIRIKMPVLAQVEGEGALNLVIRHSEIEEIKLRIYEPPRLLETFIEGHSHQDLPDVVARICGICSVSNQMSAIQALENLFEVDPGQWVRDMRRVMYCGEWIQSHSQHIHLMAIPDFFGLNSSQELAKKYPAVIERGLKLQKLGNDILAMFGERPEHTVGVKVGGFFKAPELEEVAVMRKRLHEALTIAADLVHWCVGLKIPHDNQQFISVALRNQDEYPMYDGRIVSSVGLDIGIEEFNYRPQENQDPHSTAFHCHLNDRPYLVGPLARINLNKWQLPDPVLENLEYTGINFPTTNMFNSVIARAVEIHLAVHEALHLLRSYQMPDKPAVEYEPKAGIAIGASEAARGMLWHYYSIDDNGRIKSSQIVPPTSQNQSRVEEDIGMSLHECGLDQPDDVLRLKAEQVIRNYDPCISCATHFLKIDASKR